MRYSLFFLLIFFTACNSSSEKQKSILIATAANMQFAMAELTERFTDKTGIACLLVIASSGKLTAQIKEGAPFDIFVSADMKYPAEIQNSGLSIGAPKVYAFGQLVMWSFSNDIDLGFQYLTDPSIKHIAIANPQTAPYGRAAIQCLEHHDLMDQVESKLVYGESIAQTNQFITSGAADLGFTAKSVVLSPNMKGKGKWVDVDPELYDPIDQGLVMVKGSAASNADKQLFYDYLLSRDAQEILKDFGYLVNE